MPVTVKLRGEVKIENSYTEIPPHLFGLDLCSRSTQRLARPRLYEKLRVRETSAALLYSSKPKLTLLSLGYKKKRRNNKINYVQT